MCEAIVVYPDTPVNKKDTNKSKYFYQRLVDASSPRGYCCQMDTQLFEELLNGAGTNQAGLAVKIGVTRQMLHKYKSAGIPANRVIQFEKVTGVPRERIRPDVFDEEFILRG